MTSVMGHYRNQCVLQVPLSEDALRHLDGQICTINNTKGDGACGVHAAVGTFTAGQYVCADARTFLFQTYGETSAIFWKDWVTHKLHRIWKMCCGKTC